jgi:hypothetical protein
MCFVIFILKHNFMKNNISHIKFQLDIQDFQDDKEIIETIKNILKMSKDKDFIDGFYDGDEKIKVNVSPNISFIISGCEC